MSRNRLQIVLTVAAALSAFAVRVHAQYPSQNPLEIRPLVGALIPTGDERAVLKNAVLVGAQASYDVSHTFGLVGSFGWSPSEDKSAAARPTVDLYQYDLGVEARTNDLTEGSVVSTRPYVVVGGGARTYNLRNVPNSSAQTNPLGYGALGLDVDHTGGKVGLRVEVRDNVTGFKGLSGELQDRKTRNDLQLAAGLTFGF